MNSARPNKHGLRSRGGLDDVASVVADDLAGEKAPRETAESVLTAYVSAQVAELHGQDARLRAEDPESVHRMRIATRRLRSALTSYRPLFGPTTVGDELRWLGQRLSDARDAQVLRERLGDMVAAEPPDVILGPVMARIDDELRTAQRAGLEQAMRTLDSDRYARLLAELDRVVSAPLNPEARLPADEVLPRLLERDAKRLRRAVKAIDSSRTRAHRDTSLHEARKKAKRMRYAAETAVPVLGRSAKGLARSAKTMQQVLGDHQDAVVSQQRLREYAVRAHGDGEDGFTFGRLHALEQGRAHDAELKFAKAWNARPGKTVRRWARG